LTGGEASDSRQFPRLLGIGPDIKPRAALTDKGYDAKSNRQAARALGIVPVIPVRKITAHSPRHFPKILYKARADRADHGQAEALQADRPSVREDRRKLRLPGLVRLQPDLDQIRPQDLVPLVIDRDRFL